MCIMRIPQPFASIALLLLIVSTPVAAEVWERPDNSTSGVYVSQVNQDWVMVSVNITFTAKEVSDMTLGQGPTFEQRFNTYREERVFSNSELWDMAEFACRLYDRTSVQLSQKHVELDTWNHRIDFLFACAIQ